MSRNRKQISKDVTIYHGNDHALGKFIDICDERYVNSGKDHQGEGYIVQWDELFGFATNLVQLTEGDLQGCLNNPADILAKINKWAESSLNIIIK